MGEAFRSLIIIMHDLVVVSPSYFVYEMLKVQVVINSGDIDEFNRKNKRLEAWGLSLSIILCVTSVIGAFCTSYGLKQL